MYGPAELDGPVARADTLADAADLDALVVAVRGGAVHEECTRVLELLREWLTDDRLRRPRLVLLTHDTSTDLAAAAVSGLVGSAQAEHPGRITVIELPTAPVTARDAVRVAGRRARLGRAALRVGRGRSRRSPA